MLIPDHLSPDKLFIPSTPASYGLSPDEYDAEARKFYLSAHCPKGATQAFCDRIKRYIRTRFPRYQHHEIDRFTNDAWILFQEGVPVYQLLTAVRNKVLSDLRLAQNQMEQKAERGEALAHHSGAVDPERQAAEVERHQRKKTYLYEILTDWARHCEQARWWKSRECTERMLRLQPHDEAAVDMGIDIQAQYQNCSKSMAWLRDHMKQKDVNKTVFQTIFHDRTDRVPLPEHAEHNRQFLLSWCIDMGAICFPDEILARLIDTESPLPDTAMSAIRYHCQHCRSCRERIEPVSLD